MGFFEFLNWGGGGEGEGYVEREGPAGVRCTYVCMRCCSWGLGRVGVVAV